MAEVVLPNISNILFLEKGGNMSNRIFISVSLTFTFTIDIFFSLIQIEQYKQALYEIFQLI